jgi:Flp pilus assembly pilin Flp
MTRPLALLKRLRRDDRGATLMEFAIVAPVLLTVILGLLDMTYRLWATSILVGEVEKAARDSTVEANTTPAAIAALDTRVRNAVKEINGTVTDGDFTITRRNFAEFSNSGRMEPSTGPGGVCATGHSYVDQNGSGSWDDGGRDGQGGAKDVTLYTVRVRYKAIFPVNALFGASPYHTIEAKTLLRNQPYNERIARSNETRSCP